MPIDVPHFDVCIFAVHEIKFPNWLTVGVTQYLFAGFVFHLGDQLAIGVVELCVKKFMAVRRDVISASVFFDHAKAYLSQLTISVVPAVFVVTKPVYTDLPVAVDVFVDQNAEPISPKLAPAIS